MESSTGSPPPPTLQSAPRGKPRSAWQYIFGVVVAVYTVAFAAVIWIGAGFGGRSPAPTPVSLALAFLTPTPAIPSRVPVTSTPAPPTAPPAPPTPTAPPPTPTPDPNVDFHVPLAASNTGSVQNQRVAILNITDDARPASGNARPPTGSKFITIEVLVENTGDAPANLGRWQVRTTPSGNYAATTINGFDDLLAATTPVAPRSIQRGVLVFAVPTNAKLAWIQYVPNPAYRGALYFDIA